MHSLDEKCATELRRSNAFVVQIESVMIKKEKERKKKGETHRTKFGRSSIIRKRKWKGSHDSCPKIEGASQMSIKISRDRV